MVVAHGSYLVNLAADRVEKAEILRLSERTLLDELQRCALLGIEYLVLHPGSHGGIGEVRGVENVITVIDEAFAVFRGPVIPLVETTAGQGTGIGYRFGHIHDIIDGVKETEPGACFDTCHVFSAGYDLRTGRDFGRTLEEFDRVVGIDRLKVLHLNDSVGSLGSRVDRHAHIGQGEIGLDGFSFIMNDRRFIDIPKILETPKRSKGVDMDRENIEVLRKLAGNS
jgi:deoxyribonuclease-4